ncbi:uncharacterized protein ACRADG_009919 isoform 1-T2 [Cochliomyia hominivorax]
MMETERTLKVGDVCVDCQQLGLEKYLRYFKLNLNGDTILKCESNECMYPYNDDISTSSDEEQEDVKEDLVEVNSLKFIDDFLQQYVKDNEQETTNNDIKTNSNEPTTTTQFDMSFLDNLQELNNENLSHEGSVIENNIEFDDKTETVKIIENQLMGIINSNEKLKESKIIKENVEVANNKNEELNELLRTNECFKQNELTENNFEILDNENNQILLLDSLNSTKCEITTAVIEECTNNDNETISLLTSINNPSNACKANETKVNELKSNQENDKQTTFSTFIEDNIKDCKTKIDIQSIETIKLEPSFSNILPNASDIKISNSEISSNNSNSKNSHISTLKSAKKTTKKSQTITKAPKRISNTKVTPSSISNELVTETNNKPNSSNTSSTSDIPKANILKGSDILKKLALLDEKSSKLNTKMKAARTNKKSAQKQTPELTPSQAPSLQKTDTDFSFEQLSEILIANKLKREYKNS